MKKKYIKQMYFQANNKSISQKIDHKIKNEITKQ